MDQYRRWSPLDAPGVWFHQRKDGDHWLVVGLQHGEGPIHFTGEAEGERWLAAFETSAHEVTVPLIRKRWLAAAAALIWASPSEANVLTAAAHDLADEQIASYLYDICTELEARRESVGKPDPWLVARAVADRAGAIPA